MFDDTLVDVLQVFVHIRSLQHGGEHRDTFSFQQGGWQLDGEDGTRSFSERGLGFLDSIDGIHSCCIKYKEKANSKCFHDEIFAVLM